MIIVLDLETTGLEAKDRLCAVGIITETSDGLQTHHELIKPPKKVMPSAMAVHHITNEMLADAPPFTSSKTAAFLNANNTAEHVIVGHNVEFDLAMLQKEGLVWQGQRIDTLKCAKQLIPDCEAYGLQFLRYELGLYKNETALAQQHAIPLSAHDALGDAFQTWQLYRALLEFATTDALLAMTEEVALVHKFWFGKYKGESIEQIAIQDPGYLYWMLENMLDLDSDMRHSIDYYLRNSL
jgi:exodeoxyribonuclease X